MSLSKSKCLYSYNCLHFLKYAVPVVVQPKSVYNKNVCFNEQKYVREHCRKVKTIHLSKKIIFLILNICSVHLFEGAIYELILVLYKDKVAGVKVYPRQTWIFRAHAVSACIGLWFHGAMHAVHACIGLWCIHQPVMSWAAHIIAACTYCMGFTVSSLSWIYLTPATLR